MITKSDDGEATVERRREKRERGRKRWKFFFFFFLSSQVNCASASIRPIRAQEKK